MSSLKPLKKQKQIVWLNILGNSQIIQVKTLKIQNYEDIDYNRIYVRDYII